MSALNGYKTYIVAAATILFAVLSVWKGTMDTNTAVLTIMGALGAGGLRHAISNS